MELVHGLPLTQFCDQERLRIRERLELFVPICLAIQHAHQKGIVHRDLKPPTFCSPWSMANPAEVIDFGVAKAIGGKITAKTMYTQIGSVVGTLEYMAPEQAGLRGEDIDARAEHLRSG